MGVCMAFRRIVSTALSTLALIALVTARPRAARQQRASPVTPRALLLPAAVGGLRSPRSAGMTAPIAKPTRSVRTEVCAAMTTIAGAFIDEAAGPGGPTIIRLRGGEEVFTQILIDGVQVNAPRGVQGPTRWAVYGAGSGASENGRGWRAAGDVSGGSARGVFDQPHDTRSRNVSLRLDASHVDYIELTGTARFLGMDGNLPVRDPGATRVPLDPNARNERDRFVSGLTARWNAPSGKVSQHLRASLLRENFVFEDERADVTADAFVFDFDFTLDSRRSRTESRAAFAEALLSPVDVIAGVRVEAFDGVGLDAAQYPEGEALPFRPSAVHTAYIETTAVRRLTARGATERSPVSASALMATWLPASRCAGGYATVLRFTAGSTTSWIRNTRPLSTGPVRRSTWHSVCA